MHINFIMRSKMKCSTYASSAEALNPVSFPFHGASLEGNLLWFILFNQAYVSFICAWSVLASLIQQIQAKLPILLFVSCVLKHKRSRK